jgi:hypothetical protein
MDIDINQLPNVQDIALQQALLDMGAEFELIHFDNE